MIAALRTLVFAVWSAIHAGPIPQDANAIADALVAATMQRANEAPALESHAMDLVVAAVYAEHESRLQLDPHPESWDARALISCGPWQLPCDFVRSHSLTEQASRWLQLARWGSRTCPDAPLAPLSSGSCHRGRQLAAYRVGMARSLLRRMLAATEQEE